MHSVEQELGVVPKSLLVIPNEEGDLRIEWDPQDQSQVALAGEAFQGARSRGMTGYKVEQGGQRGELITQFEAEAQRIVMAPQMVGG